VVVAQFAEIHPMIIKKFNIKTNVVIGIVDNLSLLTAMTNWSGTHSSTKIALSDFPLITRDFAFITDMDIVPDMLTARAKRADDRIIETNIFDVFDLPSGQKSVAFEIVIQPSENMSESDLSALHRTVIDCVEKNTGAKIRDK
jgi:phenylalanyl-tRNA synthetase beta subunit